MEPEHLDAPPLREMNDGDIPDVLRFWRGMPGVGLNESDTPEALIAFLNRNPGLSSLARDGSGNVIAAVLCGHDGRRGYLHHLAVLDSYRGRGIGGKLVERSLARLKPLGIPKCNIYVYNDNGPGQVFWLRKQWKKRDDILLMQCETL